MPNPPLPFLDSKKNNGGSTSAEHVGGSPGLQAAAHDLLQAIQSQDSAGVAAALKAAFELCDSEPHEEGENE